MRKVFFLKLKVRKPDYNPNSSKFLSLAHITSITIIIGIMWIVDIYALGTTQFSINSDTVNFVNKNEILFFNDKNIIATILETKVICREPGKYLGEGSEYSVDNDGHIIIKKRVVESDRYLGWPTIVRTAKGELIVAFSGDRDAHVCPWGKTQIIRSLNQGKTWSEPVTITSTPLDDRNPGLIQTTKGTLVVSWFTSLAFNSPNPYWKETNERYARYSEKIVPEIREKWLGYWVRRSEDEGKTWQDPIRTSDYSPHGPISLRDGRLLYVGTTLEGSKHSALLVEQSFDDGRKWSVMSTIPEQDPAIRVSEPHVVELSSGKLLVLVRYEPKDRSKCFMLQTESINGGNTWSPLHSTGIWGYPPHLIELRNGWVLVVYGYRRDPCSERACISRDEGKTWDLENQIILAESPTADMGYPSSVQLEDGSILTVFYQSEGLGKSPVLMSTHWRIN